jgi:hypothetical protein
MEEMVERVRETSDRPGSGPGSLRCLYDEALGTFPSCTFNVNMQSVCWPHTDQNNLAQGWCSITPLGCFDPTAGGHLVLWNFGLVVQLPPGCTALIPSGIICHSNTSLQAGEVRHSVVQYALAHLFRWVHNGCMTNKARQEQAAPSSHADIRHEQEGRWRSAVESFSTLKELFVEKKAV